MRKSIKEIIGNEVGAADEVKEIKEFNESKESKEPDEVIIDPSRLEYRRNSLKKWMADIQDAYMGRGSEFTSFVEDENGCLDEGRITSFIKEMIAGSPKAESLPEEKRQLIEDLLYCAIVGPSARKSVFYPQCFDFCFEKSQAFADIMDAARDSVFTAKDRISYMRDEVYIMCFPEASVGLFNFLFINYTAEDILRDIYTDEEYREAAHEYADITWMDLSDVLEKWGLEPEAGDAEEADVSGSDGENAATIEPVGGSHIQLSPDDTEDYEDNEDVFADSEYDLTDSDWEAIEDIWKSQEQELEYYSKICNESNKAWCDRQPADGHLKERYVHLRKNVFNVDMRDTAEIMSEMVDNFIQSHGLSPICSDKGFGLIEHELEKCLNAVNRDIKRIR